MVSEHSSTALRATGVSGFDVLREMTSVDSSSPRCHVQPLTTFAPLPPSRVLPSLTRTTPALNQKPPST